MHEEFLEESERNQLLFEFITANDDSRFKRLLKDTSPEVVQNIIHEGTKLSLLHWASLKGCFLIQNWLIDKMGFNADMDNNVQVWSPAHVAAIAGKEKCLEALLMRKADVINHPDRRGCTPLHLAAAHGRSHTLKMLLNSTRVLPLVNKTCSKNGWTAVMYATWHGRISCVELLIRHGAVTDITDNEGRSPLHLAAAEGHIEMVNYFLEHGCKETIECLTAVDNHGFTPAQAAEHNKKTEVHKLLLAKEKDPRTWETAEDIVYPGHVSAMQGDLEGIKRHMKEGHINVNDVDNRGYTMLHKATLFNRWPVVIWLLKEGASFYMKTLANETALDIAKRKNWVESRKVLEREDMEINYFTKKEEDKSIYIPILSSLDNPERSMNLDGEKWINIINENEEDMANLEYQIENARKILAFEELELLGIEGGTSTTASTALEQRKKISLIKHDIFKLQYQIELVKFNLYQLKMNPSEKELEIARALAACENQYEETFDELIFEKGKRETIEAELSSLRLELIRLRDFILTNDVPNDLLSMVIAFDPNLMGTVTVPSLDIENMPVNKNKRFSIHFEVDPTNKIHVTKVTTNPIVKGLSDLKDKGLGTLQFVRYVKFLLNQTTGRLRCRRRRIRRNKRNLPSPIGGVFVTR